MPANLPVSPKAAAKVRERRNNTPYCIIYPSTENLYAQVDLYIPAQASKKQIKQALRDLRIPGLKVHT